MSGPEEIKVVIEAIDKASATLKNIQKNTTAALTAPVGLAARASAAIGNLNTAFTKHNRIISDTTKTVLKYAAAYAGFAAMKKTVGDMIKFADVADDTRTKLEMLTGSHEKAAKYMRIASVEANNLYLHTNDVRDAISDMLMVKMDPEKWMRPLADFAAMADITLSEASALLTKVYVGGMGPQDVAAIRNPMLRAGLKSIIDDGSLAKKSLAEVQAAMFDFLTGPRIAGAQTKFSADWGGMIIRMQNHWQDFLEMIAQSGAMKALEDQLSGVLARVKELSDNGKLKEWAEKAGKAIQDVLNKLVAVGGWISEHRDGLVLIISTVAAIAAIAKLKQALTTFALMLANPYTLPFVVAVSILLHKDELEKIRDKAKEAIQSSGMWTWIGKTFNQPFGSSKNVGTYRAGTTIGGAGRGTPEQEAWAARLAQEESARANLRNVGMSVAKNLSAANIPVDFTGGTRPGGGGKSGAAGKEKKELNDKLSEFDSMYDRASKRVHAHADNLIKQFAAMKEKHEKYKTMISEFFRTGVAVDAKWKSEVEADTKAKMLSRMEGAGAGAKEKEPTTFLEGWKRAIGDVNRQMDEMALLGINAAQRLRQGFSDTFFNVFTGQVNSLRDVWSNLMNDMKNLFFRAIADMMAKNIMNNIIGPLLGQGTISAAGGGGGLSGILNMGASLGGMLANGGDASAGRTYLVGERGPELFSPRASGRVTPLTAGGGGNQYNITIQATDADSFREMLQRDGGEVIASHVVKLAPGAVASDIARGGSMRSYFGG